MKQPLFTINSTFSEEEVVRFNKYVTLHMSHYVRNVVICNIILLLFTVGTIVNEHYFGRLSYKLNNDVFSHYYCKLVSLQIANTKSQKSLSPK